VFYVARGFSRDGNTGWIEQAERATESLQRRASPGEPRHATPREY